MKTQILLTGFVLLLFINCSKDKENEVSDKVIFGIWSEQSYYEDCHRISKLTYNFRDDFSFEILRAEIETLSGNILGYRYKQTGKYTSVKNNITFNNLKTYINDDTQADYSKLEDLQQIYGDEAPYTLSYVIKGENDTLELIYPPCGTAENCIGYTILKKEESL